jgi:hypothetical protein
MIGHVDALDNVPWLQGSKPQRPGVRSFLMGKLIAGSEACAEANLSVRKIGSALSGQISDGLPVSNNCAGNPPTILWMMEEVLGLECYRLLIAPSGSLEAGSLLR